MSSLYYIGAKRISKYKSILIYYSNIQEPFFLLSSWPMCPSLSMARYSRHSLIWARGFIFIAKKGHACSSSCNELRSSPFHSIWNAQIYILTLQKWLQWIFFFFKNDNNEFFLGSPGSAILLMCELYFIKDRLNKSREAQLHFHIMEIIYFLKLLKVDRFSFSLHWIIQIIFLKQKTVSKY